MVTVNESRKSVDAEAMRLAEHHSDTFYISLLYSASRQAEARHDDTISPQDVQRAAKALCDLLDDCHVNFTHWADDPKNHALYVLLNLKKAYELISRGDTQTDPIAAIGKETEEWAIKHGGGPIRDV